MGLGKRLGPPSQAGSVHQSLEQEIRPSQGREVFSRKMGLAEGKEDILSTGMAFPEHLGETRDIVPEAPKGTLQE